MHIPRAFCTNDNLEMTIHKTGAFYEVFNALGSYYKVAVDEFICGECGFTVALPSRQALASHRDPNYFNIPTHDVAHLAD
jgi:hypothetical protein